MVASRTPAYAANYVVTMLLTISANDQLNPQLNMIARVSPENVKSLVSTRFAVYMHT